ncbi:unnamed protein product [Didymodactylos carnosus]|uniref:PHD finger protein 10 n=1 Tax=Didymodactylos carnosus TaxID=1234261 RepID=A0A813SK90_9BILA|nr:unnamed protein product [Didymodactylos carnosus]CAF0802251.1 unnamed protein product [Didymodactylos carnosus]CAF3582295.1 unnamed protein product [Didymodactylos carnosus]CAF3585670.1 unnamed protein product [Didymodactylos carnosus]
MNCGSSQFPIVATKINIRDPLMSTIHSSNVVMPVVGGVGELVTNSYPSPVKSNHDQQMPTSTVFIQQTLNHNHHNHHNNNNNRTYNNSSSTTSKSVNHNQMSSDDDDEFSLLTIKTSLKRNRSPSITDETTTNHKITVNENTTGEKQDLSPPIPIILTEKTITNGPTTVTGTAVVRRNRKKRQTADIDHSLGRHLSADRLHVYRWPNGDSLADLHVLQEQICDYLSLKSFKRKYPDITRRVVDLHEREYLKSQNVVTETQCDLGLTALKLDEILHIMSIDYPDKHRINDRSAKQPALNIRHDIIRSTAEYNQQIQKERRKDRRACFDLQTMQIHFPAHTQFRLPPNLSQVGSYPVALVPGQYHDAYIKYTSDELKYMPINTALYYYPKPLSLIQAERLDQVASSDEENEDEMVLGSSPQNQQYINISSAPIQSHPPSVALQSQQIQSSPVSNNTYIESQSSYTNGPLSRTLINKQNSLNSHNNQSAEELSSSNNSITAINMCYVCKQQRSSKQQHDDLFVTCSTCLHRSHPHCLDINLEMLQIIQTYQWQCMDCKNCSTCNKPHDEVILSYFQLSNYSYLCSKAQMMFCDRCDRGYHTYCVGLQAIPDGSWQCSACVIYKREAVTPPPLSTTPPIPKNKQGRIANNSRLSSLPITTTTSSSSTAPSRGRGNSRRGRVKAVVSSSTNHSFPLSPLNTSSNSSTTNDASTPLPHMFVQPSIPSHDTSLNSLNPILNYSPTIASSSLTLNANSSNLNLVDSKHSWTTNNQR